jgi:hypothetical protein
MKRTFLPAAVIALSLIMTSCGGGSSFESDVRKMADYRCKIQKLEAKGPSDEKAKKEAEDIGKEMMEFAQKMEKKYESKKDDKDMEAKATAIMKEVMEKCGK